MPNTRTSAAEVGQLDEIILEAVLGAERDEDDYHGFMSRYFAKLLREELGDPIPERIIRKDSYRAVGPKRINWEKLAGWAALCEPGGGHNRLERLAAEFYRGGILVPKSRLLGVGYLVYWTLEERKLNCLVRRRYRPESNTYECEEALFASEKDAQAFCYFYNQHQIEPRAEILRLERKNCFQCPVIETSLACTGEKVGEDWITAVPLKK